MKKEKDNWIENLRVNPRMMKNHKMMMNLKLKLMDILSKQLKMLLNYNIRKMKPLKMEKKLKKLKELTFQASLLLKKLNLEMADHFKENLKIFLKKILKKIPEMPRQLKKLMLLKEKLKPLKKLSLKKELKKKK